MKQAPKVALWVIATLVAIFLYYAVNEDTRTKWGLGLALAYAFWLVLKQVTDFENRNAARLDRIEEMLHQQRGEGLSIGEREGLSEMIFDHRKSKREVRDGP